MKIHSHIVLLVLVCLSVCYGQDDGGNLCGPEPEESGHPPYWILRFEIIDSESHSPISGARVKIKDDGGNYGYSWNADNDGIAVLVVSDPRCIPSSGQIEFTFQDYKYHKQEIQQWDFVERENTRRIYLEGHRHNWTGMNQVPTTQEIIDKIRANRYQVGVRTTENYGAPALFEYVIEMKRLPRYR